MNVYEVAIVVNEAISAFYRHSMQRIRVLIEGRVQGVFFRAHMQRVAKSLGLKGWVRNLPDGRVEALLEGTQTNISSMLDWCRQGPPHSSVTRLEATEEPYLGDCGEFIIRY